MARFTFLKDSAHLRMFRGLMGPIGRKSEACAEMLRTGSADTNDFTGEEWRVFVIADAMVCDPNIDNDLD